MRLLILILCLAPGLVWAQKDKKTFEFTGSITGIPGKTTVYVADVNEPTDTIAKAVAVGGKFVLKGTVKEPSLHHIVFVESKKKLLLYAGNDKVKVTGDIATLQKATVSGSPSHDVFVAFQKQFNPTFERLQQSTVDGSGVSFTNDDYEALEKSLDSFILANKNSYVSPFVMIVTSQLTEDMNVLERRYNMLSKDVQQSYFGKYVAETIADSKIGEVGSQAIEFTQNDTAGNPVSLSSFRGKYVLIDFWASWCGPCRAENPNVVAAYEKFKGKNFTILGVSLDRNKKNWLDAIADDNLTWTQVSDLKFWQNAAAEKYKIESIPANYLVDPSGKIIARNLRGEALEMKLCEVLGGCK